MIKKYTIISAGKFPEFLGKTIKIDTDNPLKMIIAYDSDFCFNAKEFVELFKYFAKWKGNDVEIIGELYDNN